MTTPYCQSYSCDIVPHLKHDDTLVALATKRCIVCSEGGTVLVPEDRLGAWYEGSFVQDAFPSLSVDEREQLITGTHPACWQQLFGDEED